MSFEVRIGGEAMERFDRPEDAEARARALVLENADIVVEVIDLATGRPYAPAASAEDRDAMARNIGF